MSAPVSAKPMRWRRRLAYAALSGLAGWALAQVATFPANLGTAVRDSEHHRMLETLALGLFVWGGWTLALSLVAWLLIAVPLVLVIRPCLLVRLRGYILGGALLAAAAATLSKLRAFHDTSATTRFLQFFEMVPYGIFAAVFAVGTAWIYIALVSRWLDRHPADDRAEDDRAEEDRGVLS
ncbi:MAG: hypothetical protein ACR2JE_13080 [Acidobacteriaceae bacterium]